MYLVRQVLAFGAVALISALPALADESILTRGDAALERGNYDEAITCWRGAAQEERELALQRLYQLYSNLHRYDEAIQCLTELIGRSKNAGRYRMEMAELYRRSGNFYGAQRAYEDQLSANPGDQSAMIGAGECLEATGNYDAARDYYTKAASLEGSRTGTARARLARMKNAAAVSSIDADAEIGKWDISQKKVLKVAILEARNVKGFRPQFIDYVTNAVSQWNAAARGLFTLEIDNGKPDQAELVVSWADKIAGALGVTMPEWGLDGKLKRASIVIACNSDAQGHSLPPESSATRALYDAQDRMLREVTLHEFGHALGLEHSPRTDDIMANGVFGMHSSDVMSARNLQPGDIDRLVQLYTSPETAKEKMMADAAAAVRKPVDGKGGVRVNGRMTVEDGGGGGEAVRAMHTNPTAEALQSAVFELNTGNNQRCIDKLKKILHAQPDNAQAHYLMAIAYVNLRQFSEAIAQYERVLKVQPTGKLAQLASAGLAKLKR